MIFRGWFNVWCNLFIVFLVCVRVRSRDLDFAVVIDAGSTGTRIYVYSYSPSDPMGTMAAVSHKRVRPSLSSFINETSFDTEALTTQFDLLVHYAKQHIPESSWSGTPFMIAATAGLRRMDESLRVPLIAGAKEVLLLSASDFAFLPEASGVISGDEEALYDVMAVSLVAHKNKAELQDIGRYGVIDLGGSSMQYAYPLEEKTCGTHDKRSYFLRSFSGLGLIEGMETLLAFQLDRGQERNPCVPPGGVPFDDGMVEGNGDFGGCVALIKELYLERMLEVSGESVCKSSSISSTFTPKVVVGLDNVPPLLHLLGLAPLENSRSVSSRSLISPKDIAESAERLCQRPWQSLLEEVAPSLPPYRGHRACYGSALLFVLLEEVVLGKCGKQGSEEHASEEHVLLPLAELPTFGELSWALGAALRLSGQINEQE